MVLLTRADEAIARRKRLVSLVFRSGTKSGSAQTSAVELGSVPPFSICSSSVCWLGSYGTVRLMFSRSKQENGLVFRCGGNGECRLCGECLVGRPMHERTNAGVLSQAEKGIHISKKNALDEIRIHLCEYDKPAPGESRKLACILLAIPQLK